MLVDPLILEEEQRFKTQQQKGGLSTIQLELSNQSEDEEEAISPPRLVASLDLIAQNADFIKFP